MQQMRSRGGARSLCHRRLLPRAEGGEGGSSTPGLVSKPYLSRPPQRPAPAPPSQEKGSQSQDKPARQGSGGGYKRQNSFQEGSAGNGPSSSYTFKLKISFLFTYSCTYSKWQVQTAPVLRLECCTEAAFWHQAVTLFSITSQLIMYEYTVLMTCIASRK